FASLFSDHRHSPPSLLFPYTTLFRSCCAAESRYRSTGTDSSGPSPAQGRISTVQSPVGRASCPGSSDCASRTECSSSRSGVSFRSEEHTSELQSRFDLVCRLLLEKKN